MKDDSPYKLWFMAGELNSSIVGSVIKIARMPHWIDCRYKRRKIPGDHPVTMKKWHFESVETYGKSLILKLKSVNTRKTKFLACNLGNGRWITQDKTEKFHPCSDSIYLFLEMIHPLGYEYNLIFYDRKRLGKVEIRQHVHDIELINRYGPPIDSALFTRDWLDFVFTHVDMQMSVHGVLYKQKYFAGMTSRMISEICFLANIAPETNARSINEEQRARLYHAVLVVFGSFSRIKGKYEYMIWSKVDCAVCESKIIKKRVRNYFVFYCPVCQDPNFVYQQPISEEFVNEILRISSLSRSN